MKHPGPWTYSESGYVTSENRGEDVCEMLTKDPEAIAIVTHAAEMWKLLSAIVELDATGALDYLSREDECTKVLGDAGYLLDEIAAAKKETP